MAYTRNTWKNQTDLTFDPLTDPPISAANLNNIEQGIVDAHSHIAATDNPHSVTASQVGLGNVTNNAQLTTSQLETTITDNDSKVPSSGAVVDYVAAHQGSGDMSKSTYDSNADGKVNSADSADAVPWTGVSGKPSTFPPEAHNHDASYAAIGHNHDTTYSPIGHDHAGVYEPVISTKKTAFNVDFGTTAGTACQGNDSRLSDARTPTSHSHTHSDISSLVTTVTDDDTKIPTAGAIVDYVSGLGGGDMLKSTYDTDADGKVNAAVAADSVPWSGVSGKPATYPPEAHNHDTSYEPIIATKNSAFNVNFGTSVGTACQGNDSRLSDARAPTSHTHGNITNGGLIGTTANLPIITGTGGILQAGAFGTGATDFAAGNHSHSGYASSTHASSHVTGGSDVIANAIASGNAGLMSGADKAKLDAIEAGATADLTASEIVTLVNASAYVINDANLAATLSRTSHVHGNITASGYLGSTASRPLITGTAGIIQAGSFGSGAGTFCQGNDSRLSDARTPAAHTHGNVTNAGAIGSTANLPLITTTDGVVTVGAFGTGATNFCVGNDSRLSDARTPTSHNNSAHSETYITAAGVTYEQLNTNGDVGTTASTLCVGNDSRLSDARTPTSHTHGNITNAGYIGSTANVPIITGTGGILQAGSFGTTANTFCAGDDTRLVTNAKQADRPFVFQTGHTAWATGLSNEEIGRIQLQTGETLYIKRVEIQIKGGGTSSSLSVNAYDSTNTTTIASQTAGGVNTTGGNSGAAALVLIRLTNSVGSTQNASVYISGWIRS